MIRPPDGCDSLLVASLANIRYLTGFTGSSACILLTKRRRLFFTDSRYRQQASSQVRCCDVRIVGGDPLTGAARYAAKRGVRLGVIGYEADQISHESYLRLRRELRGVRFRDAGGTIERRRSIKTARESRRIAEAAGIADAALERLARTKVIGRSEIEVAWMLESWMRREGSEALPFEIIVASGARSALPHGVASRKIIKQDELVLVDLGAKVDGYCSDMTRTFSTGRLGGRREKIHGVVVEAHETALGAATPGIGCSELDGAARSVIDRQGYGAAFGHSLGHGVGLQAHEAPSLAPKSRERLEVGMVFTIEPGIYVAGLGGVRIEDTVVMEERGPRILTSFPRALRNLK